MAVVFERLPDVPVTVTFTVPAGAAVPAVNVNVLVLVVLFGLKEAVTPLGRPVADKLTLPLKPFCGTTEMVLVPLVPGAMLTLLGDAERVKLGTTTVNATDVVLVKLPEVPVMVTFAVPAGAAVPAVNVNVLVLVVLPGLKDAVTPLGKPDADKLTLPLKPFCAPTEMVLVPLVACAMLKVVGDAESVNVGVATVTVTDVVLLKFPDVPVMTTFAVPAGALLLALKVSVLVPLVAPGLKDALTPLGRPDADKLTLPLNPFCGMTEMVLVPLVPGVMLRAPGDTESAKLGAGVMTETLSKVAVARVELEPLLAAKPMYTVAVMARV